jgi:hypothetical protein
MRKFLSIALTLLLTALLLLAMFGCEVRVGPPTVTPAVTVTSYDYYDYCSGDCCYYYDYYEATYPWYEVCEVIECYDSYTEYYEFVEETCWYE